LWAVKEKISTSEAAGTWTYAVSDVRVDDQSVKLLADLEVADGTAQCCAKVVSVVMMAIV
jgi:hypothetical protein